MRTDHQAIQWLFSLKNPRNRIARWIESFAEFSFEIQHRPGNKHQNADTMSRCQDPWNCQCKDLEKLRCGPCKKCLRKTELMSGIDVAPESPETEHVNQVQVQKLASLTERFKICAIEKLVLIFIFLINLRKTVHKRSSHWKSASKEKLHDIKRLARNCKISRSIRACIHNHTRPFFKELKQKRHYIRVAKENLRNAWPFKTKYQDMGPKQRQDPVLGAIYQRKLDEKRPSSAEVAPLSSEVRHYWLLWGSLTIEKGVLCRKFHKQDGTDAYLQVIIPHDMRNEVLEQMHDNILSGHLGEKKTRERTLQRFYWMNLRNDVKLWVQQCDVCHMIKTPSKNVRAPLGSMPTGSPWDRIATDILGPLPESSSGNKYIMVVSDYFSKWVEVFPIPDQTAATCARILLNEVISRYGCPYDIHSDQGRNYTSQIFVELCQLLGIRKTQTTPYHPSGNGQVERFNHTIIRMIKSFIQGEQRNWDQNLGCLAAAYRSTVHETTHFTPNFLIFGHENRLPTEILFSVPREESTTYCDHVASIQGKMEKAHEVTRRHLKKKAQRQKEHYDAKATLNPFKAGDLVWYASPSEDINIAPKLRRSYMGPVLIVKKFNDLTYQVQLNAKGVKKIVHHDKLLSYKGR